MNPNIAVIIDPPNIPVLKKNLKIKKLFVLFLYASLKAYLSSPILNSTISTPF